MNITRNPDSVFEAFIPELKLISTMIRRLAKVNGEEIGPNKEKQLGYCAMQFYLLACKISEGDNRSDVSGCAALPRLFFGLCGPERTALTFAP